MTTRAVDLPRPGEPRLVTLMTGVSPAHLMGMIIGIVTSLPPNSMRAVKSQLSPASLRTETMVYLSDFGAPRPAVYWPDMVTLVRRSVRAFSRSAWEGWVAGGTAGCAEASDVRKRQRQKGRRRTSNIQRRTSNIERGMVGSFGVIFYGRGATGQTIPLAEASPTRDYLSGKISTGFPGGVPLGGVMSRV